MLSHTPWRSCCWPTRPLLWGTVPDPALAHGCRGWHSEQGVAQLLLQLCLWVSAWLCHLTGLATLPPHGQRHSQASRLRGPQTPAQPRASAQRPPSTVLMARCANWQKPPSPSLAIATFTAFPAAIQLPVQFQLCTCVHAGGLYKRQDKTVAHSALLPRRRRQLSPNTPAVPPPHSRPGPLRAVDKPRAVPTDGTQAIAVSHQQLLHKYPFQTPAWRAASPGRLAKPQP